jgi:hypothetical protein
MWLWFPGSTCGTHPFNLFAAIVRSSLVASAGDRFMQGLAAALSLGFRISFLGPSSFELVHSIGRPEYNEIVTHVHCL